MAYIVNMIARFAYNLRPWDHRSFNVHRFLCCIFMRSFVKYGNPILFHNDLPSALCGRCIFLRSSKNPHSYMRTIFGLIFQRPFVMRVASKLLELFAL